MSVRQNSLKNFVFSDVPETSSETITQIPITTIIPSSYQSRRYFDDSKISELAESIRQFGILEPLLVRPLDERPGYYELVAGERRYKASLQAELTEIPVNIRRFSDKEALSVSLIENLQREDLNPLEETEGILQLLSVHLDLPVDEVITHLYRMRNESSGSVSQNVLTNSMGLSIQSVFSRIGRLSWESFITSRLPLLKLPEEILEALRQGKIAYTKALTIAQLKDSESRQKLLDESISNNLSLTQIKESVKKVKNQTLGNQSLTPRQELTALNKKLQKSKIWENPKKWKKLQTLLAKIESLIEEDVTDHQRSIN